MKSIISLIAGAVLLGAAGVAGADEPMLLTAAQMEKVTAGAGATSSGVLTGPVLSTATLSCVQCGDPAKATTPGAKVNLKNSNLGSGTALY